MSSEARFNKIDDMADAIARHLRHDIARSLVEAIKCCPNCIQWPQNNPMELCGKYNERPPAHIIAFGCKSFVDKTEVPY